MRRLCNDIIREEIKEVAPHRERSALPTPHEIRTHTDVTLSARSEQRLLAVAVYNRYKRLRNGIFQQWRRELKPKAAFC